MREGPPDVVDDLGVGLEGGARSEFDALEQLRAEDGREGGTVVRGVGSWGGGGEEIGRWGMTAARVGGEVGRR